MSLAHTVHMSWTWVEPADPSLLDGRPLLDLGTGDGQTLASLARGPGLVVGLDTSMDALRAARTGRRVAGQAERSPFRDSSFAVVLAADLFHHVDDNGLTAVLWEVRRILAADGLLVAWWYERPARPGPDAPRYPRAFRAVASAAEVVGFLRVRPLELEYTIEPAPATVGLVALRS